MEYALSHDLILLVQSMGDGVWCDGYVSSEKCFQVADLACDVSVLRKKLSKMIREGDLFTGGRQWKAMLDWLKVRSENEDLISISIPLRNDEKKNKYVIHYRKNSGEDIRTDARNLNECISLIKKLKNSSNYMICIEENAEVIKVWNKDIAINSNKWRTSSPDALQIIGKLPVIYSIK